MREGSIVQRRFETLADKSARVAKPKRKAPLGLRTLSLRRKLPPRLRDVGVLHPIQAGYCSDAYPHVLSSIGLARLLPSSCSRTGDALWLRRPMPTRRLGLILTQAGRDALYGLLQAEENVAGHSASMCEDFLHNIRPSKQPSYSEAQFDLRPRW